jgi:hypothetical protein
MDMKPWAELERLSAMLSMLHWHLTRAAEHVDGSEVRRIRAEIAFAEKQRSEIVGLLCRQDIHA